MGKKKQARKTNSLAVKLQTVRNSMASDMGKAYKKGSALLCTAIGNGTEDGNGGSLKKSKTENIIVLPISLKITQCIKPAWILMTSVTYVVIMNLENSSKTIEKAVILLLVMLMLHQRLMMLKIPQEDGFGKIKLLIIKLLLMIFLLQENKGLIDF